METLLNKSSAAKRVLKNNDPAIAAEMGRARQLLQQARESNGRQGRELLSQAKQTLFAALRSSTKGASLAPHSGELPLVRTTRILLAAYARILEEKSLADTRNVAAGVRAKLALSEEKREAGETKLAEQYAESAFHRVREAIVALRQGDTLVRSLHFDSPADEYRYEADRNQTHEMLVKLLIQKQTLSDTDRVAIQRLLESANQLRKQADDHAGEQDYPSAIKALEGSTQYFIRAIRAAGIYIPG